VHRIVKVHAVGDEAAHGLVATDALREVKKLAKERLTRGRCHGPRIRTTAIVRAGRAAALRGGEQKGLARIGQHRDRLASPLPRFHQYPRARADDARRIQHGGELGDGGRAHRAGLRILPGRAVRIGRDGPE